METSLRSENRYIECMNDPYYFDLLNIFFLELNLLSPLLKGAPIPCTLYPVRCMLYAKKLVPLIT